MAGIASILAALAKVSWRGVLSVSSFQENNFFVLGCILLLQSGPFLRLLLGAMVLLPLATSALRAVPPERWDLLPLNRAERTWLRLGSLCMNPVVVVAAVGVAATRDLSLALLLLAGMVGTQVCAALVDTASARAPSINLFRWVPPLPGMLGPMVSKNLRETIATLDFWVAALLALSTTAYRLLYPQAQPEAMMAVTILIVVAALGTCAQCLFGLDAAAGRVRYRLMPLRGWQVLFAKDTAFLLVACALTLPLAPATGLACALVSLAVGHHLSVFRQPPQRRWRFVSGSVSAMAWQAVGGVSAGVAVYREGPLWLLPCLIAWALSLWWYGRIWDEL